MKTKLEVIRGDVIDFIRNCHVGYEKVYSEKRNYGYQMKFYRVFDSRLPFKSVLQHFEEFFPKLKIAVNYYKEEGRDLVNLHIYIPKELYEGE